MCLFAAIMSFRGYFGLGSMVRWFSFALFVGALWLTTPWWGRRDFMILHFQRRALMVVIGTVLVGLAVSPTKAFAGATGGRLGGIVWPIQPTQVAHYSAVLVGITVVFWLAGASKSSGQASSCRRVRRSDPHPFPDRAGFHVGRDSRWRFESLPQPKRVRRAFVVAILVVGIGALALPRLLPDGSQEVRTLRR